MAEALKKLHDFPDVSFIDNISFTEVQERMIKNFEKRYRELTGKDISLAPADPYRLILYCLLYTSNRGRFKPAQTGDC